MGNLPAMDSVTLQNIYYTKSAKEFLVEVEVTFTGMGQPFTVLDKVEVNDDMKIIRLEASFHPSAVKGGKPPFAGDVETFVANYANALFKHEPLNEMFAAERDVLWQDPVGTPAHAGKEAIAERISKLPDMDSVTLRNVYFTKDPKTFWVAVEVTFTGKGQPFTVMDKVALA